MLKCLQQLEKYATMYISNRTEVKAMLCRIKIPFESSRGLHYNFYASSVMQGVMMENIPSFYAEALHRDKLRPYSQFCTNDKGKNVWIVSVLSREAYENIILPLMQLETAEVRYKKDMIIFSEPETEMLTYEQLLEENAAGKGGAETIRLDIITPAAFKSSGRYMILPTLRLIFNSLAKRFDSFYGIAGNDYEGVAEEAEKNITIIDYSLTGADFTLEGVHIPAFTGNITMKVAGSREFRSYIRMLCRFAEFSGVGIKTAIGMGSVHYHSI